MTFVFVSVLFWRWGQRTHDVSLAALELATSVKLVSDL